jgi:hypothetical protein
MNDDVAIVIQALELQGVACTRFGSAFSAAVAQAVATDIKSGGAFADLAQPWAGRDVRALFAGALALRFLGGLHYLVLSGAAPDLAANYPPAATEADPSRLALAVAIAAKTHKVWLADFLTSPPQTNEVNRSVCLSAGFLTIAQRSGLPLRCLEIGASAGLNMNWDRYRYEMNGAGAWGDPASPVRLDAEWTGGPPPKDVPIRVIERRGCDQNPIDITTDESALRLKAYVWPDQAERMARLDGAIQIARRYPPSVERADAADWIRAHLTPEQGAATIIYHSVVWSYLPDQTQADVAGAIAAAGESASANAPLAWLRMEPLPTNLVGPMALTLTYWPSGAEFRLADVHPHGAKVSWMGD